VDPALYCIYRHFEVKYTGLFLRFTNSLCLTVPGTCWRTAIQAGRSWVRFPMVSLELFIDTVLLAALWLWGWPSLWQKWVSEIFAGDKGGRCVVLTALPHSWPDVLQQDCTGMVVTLVLCFSSKCLPLVLAISCILLRTRIVFCKRRFMCVCVCVRLQQL